MMNDTTRRVGRGVFLGVSHARAARGQGPSAPQFLVPSTYAYSLWRRTTKFGVVTHMGRGLFLGVCQAPIPRRRGPNAPQFWGFPHYAYTLWRTTTKFLRGNRYEEGLVLGCQSRPLRHGSLLFFAHTVCHKSSKFDLVTHVVQGRVFWGQPRPPS